MAENLEIVVNQPIQVFALRAQRPCQPISGLGVVCRRIGVIAVVFVILVTGEVDGCAGLVAALAEELYFCGVRLRVWMRREVRRVACGCLAVGVETLGWWLILWVSLVG